MATKFWFCAAFALVSVIASAAVVSPVPEAVRTSFGLKPFYQKCLLLPGGFPVVSSGTVSDAALEEAGVLLRSMLGRRPDIFEALARNRVRFTVMAVSERTCDVPEHSDLSPALYWNRRARGLGASAARPSVSCGEENLLCLPTDPYKTENILIHEFAHAVHELGIGSIDPTFDQRLRATYQAALAEGKWKDTYAATNHQEYWAEMVQSWFGSNRENDQLHNAVNTRPELEAYDPRAAALCAEVFGETRWEYRRSDDPARADEPHLKGLDRKTFPAFAWSDEEQRVAITKTP